MATKQKKMKKKDVARPLQTWRSTEKTSHRTWRPGRHLHRAGKLREEKGGLKDSSENKADHVALELKTAWGANFRSSLA